jgi:hypothetical protein
MFSETDTFKMLELLIDNIFECFGDVFFKGQSEFLLRTNYASLIYLPICSLFVWGRLHTRASQDKRKASPILQFHIRYIDHILLLHNSKFGDYVDSIYPIEIEIKDTTGKLGLLRPFLLHDLALDL